MKQTKWRETGYFLHLFIHFSLLDKYLFFQALLWARYCREAVMNIKYLVADLMELSFINCYRGDGWWWLCSCSVMSDSCDPMDCSLPDSSVHGILQARLLEWIAISFSRVFSRPRNWTWVSCIAGPTEEMKPVNSKGNQPWIFTGRTDAEAEAPILWPPDMKSQFIRKDPDSGKDWRQKEKGVKEDEMVR